VPGHILVEAGHAEVPSRVPPYVNDDGSEVLTLDSGTGETSRADGDGVHLHTMHRESFRNHPRVVLLESQRFRLLRGASYSVGTSGSRAANRMVRPSAATARSLAARLRAQTSQTGPPHQYRSSVHVCLIA
jgi:hypothetical protein